MHQGVAVLPSPDKGPVEQVGVEPENRRGVDVVVDRGVVDYLVPVVEAALWVADDRAEVGLVALGRRLGGADVSNDKQTAHEGTHTHHGDGDAVATPRLSGHYCLGRRGWPGAPRRRTRRCTHSKRISSMMMLLLPPNQKPIANCDGDERLIPLATIGMRMSCNDVVSTG